MPDSTNLDAEPALDVLAAMNVGIQEFYANAPDAYKRTTLSHAVRAPAVITPVFTAQYANTVGAATFTTKQFGCTVRFDSGAADTMVTGTNTVLDDLLVPTLSQPGMIYSDAIPLRNVIERVLGNARVYDPTRSEPTTLYRDERLRGGRARWGEGGLYQWFATTSEVGRPLYYFLDPVGASQGGDPEFLLRLWPLPAADYTIRMEAQLGPRTILFAELSTATSVSVPDNRIESVLLPLCEAALTNSHWWRDPSTKTVVMQKAQSVLTTRLDTLPPDVAPSQNRSYTPRGF